MRGGADFIYQGIINSGNRLGRPDLLVKGEGRSKFDNHYYYPTDIKLSTKDGEWDNEDEKKG